MNIGATFGQNEPAAGNSKLRVQEKGLNIAIIIIIIIIDHWWYLNKKQQDIIRAMILITVQCFWSMADADAGHWYENIPKTSGNASVVNIHLSRLHYTIDYTAKYKQIEDAASRISNDIVLIIAE